MQPKEVLGAREVNALTKQPERGHDRETVGNRT